MNRTPDEETHKRPLPAMYQNLLDALNRHLANADQARQMGNGAQMVAELQNARVALADFQVLLDEVRRSWV